ncbi:peptide deformylase 1A, chloroplastic/mitochondrial [Rhodamnia argentea]|uniref:Peptide deformylase n=1 Tax=Rhodamnia argentea TaxID=178133 RepID=A0A8B8NRT7_9MYRT|nr:peptide deformylase 1A, chloroplastic/mitochondrial [Rhodamnia argentea]XP_030525221.2 peptide deformylase 1A, chloroplastic/mitochondrial [Rhodamnia argentea]XP_030525224.2 peptide deformylase 1A, chloroplastic/mitochondrial [Rhodamnia argentea]
MPAQRDSIGHAAMQPQSLENLSETHDPADLPTRATMESIHRASLQLRLLPLSLSPTPSRTIVFRTLLDPAIRRRSTGSPPKFNLIFTPRRRYSNPSSTARAGWLLGLAGDKKVNVGLPDIVKAGDPVLHEPAGEVDPADVGSERIQKIIDDMVMAMRKAPGVGLAAPQIGIPLRIIVLEDTKEYISYAPKEETKAQDRRPFDLLVILNPKLKKKSNRTALFFEGCLSVDGYRGLVERDLDVEVTGLGRDGKPIKVDASGWQARILQHECDHLGGTLYVDKMVPRTFRIVENLDLPLADGCPRLGVRDS